ncbi:ABC transporter G family member 17 [Selaginella moellendorffii]|uniref:ABC transporter G family member 17 n=1 Tax=Selaginella moellendorffii TaxID=88036 RepID=UPI000D1C5893|nr:ABC transporter G family member 17 [Selaginella moellendorffii]|eukprot:XP_024521382.1 ABC transporter G family member 17 [Selaginella moellendorffii]
MARQKHNGLHRHDQPTLQNLLGSATPYSHAGSEYSEKNDKLYGPGLVFEDLLYSVSKKVKKEGKSVVTSVDLLHNISGEALKGHVTAVLGPSGAGKSTFLDALAGRICKGSLRGRVTVDGRAVSTSMMKRISSYVMQDDQLFPMLTVYETFLFAANVRLPSAFTPEEKKARVEELITQLGLEHAADTYIGNEGVRGVSGGERRRVSIGVDIIHGPSLLFLDEPTSGLDSTSAFVVVERLRDIAQRGSTVILTIHQPSYRIQQLLNRLIVLARGKLIYLGKPDALEDHLAGLGRPVPDGENALENLLDVIKEYDESDLGLEPLVQFQRDGVRPDGLGAEATPLPSKNRNRNYYQVDAEDDNDFDRSLPKSMAMTPLHNDPRLAAQFYREFSAWLYNEAIDTLRRTPARTPARALRGPTLSAWRTPIVAPEKQQRQQQQPVDVSVSCTVALDDRFQPAHAPYSDFSTDDEEESEEWRHKFANPWSRELVVLMWRNYKNVYRTPELFLSRELVIVVMSAMLATLFKRPKDTLDGVNELMNFYIFAVCLLFFSSNDAVPTFIQERFIFIREASHNAYRASSYVIANLIVNLPFLAIQALTFVVITWWTLRLHGSVFTIWLILFASLITTNSFVMFVSAVVPNYIMGYAVVIAITALFFLNCGYFLKRSQIPGVWLPLHYISTIKYPFEALLVNQFDNGYHACYANGPVFEKPGPLGKVHTSVTSNSSCTVDGTDVLKTMDMGGARIGVDVLVLLAWGVFYRLLFYVIIRFYSKNQRH